MMAATKLQQHRRTVSDVFNIEVIDDEGGAAGNGGESRRYKEVNDQQQHPGFGATPKCSPSSSSSDFQNTSDSNFLLRRDDAYRGQYSFSGELRKSGLGRKEELDEELDQVQDFERNLSGLGVGNDDDGEGINDEDDDDGSQFETSAGTDCSRASRVAVDSFRRWSANFGKSIKNNKRNMYNKTVRLMPSRLQKTLSIDGDLITTTASDIEQITLELEQREQLMGDNPHSEQLRIDAIKSMAQTLSIKRQIRANLTRTVNRRSVSRSRSVGFLRKCKYRTKLLASRLSKLMRHSFTNFELFYGSMKEIEGHFGSRISAYFKFLRWLLVLDLVLVIFVFWFVTFPQILYSGVEEVQNRTDPVELFTAGRSDFMFTDLFTAEGYFTDSIMFYGFYSDASFTLIPGTSEYSLPHAYFLTIVVMSLTIFVVVSLSMARSYRISFIEASGAVHNILTHKIFCSWDFGIANEKAAQLKHAAIFHDLNEYLSTTNKAEGSLGRWHKIRGLALHMVAHSAVLTMITSICFGIWTMLKWFGETEHFSTWAALYVSITTNVTMFTFSYVFRFISRLEKYQRASTALNINLLRNFLLQLCIIGVLVFYWLNKTYESCWETSVGQEIYRLVVIDFIVSVLFLAFLQATRYSLNRFYSRSISLPEFCLTNNSLGLVYNQTLLWFGLLFSPLLCVIVAGKLFLMFYIKKFSLIYFCKPPSKLWRSSQTHTLLLVLIFVSLFGVMVTHGYIMTQIPVSKDCGPFREDSYMYQLFMQGILKLKEEHIFWKIFIYITKPAIIGGVLLTMAIAAYYLRAKSKAQIAKVKLLKELLCLEAKDKEFLLANISRITRGRDWSHQDHLELLNGRKLSGADRYCSDPSGTWRYAESPRKISVTSVLNGDGPSGSGYHRIDECNEERVRMRRF
ncbi:transmembrane channel-like protein 5 [Uranotaenia lowii]|uniref:transmembrane channel-like protein 5 n=1 Tax=Uranotaenia lowii TaxID=190385 RepID=UPI002478FFC1|nr:transmembrane channel-like protein 5 [Uranotaenia lowii]